MTDTTHTNTTINVHIEKLIFGGQGLGRIDNKVVLAWNALPAEVVEVVPLKKKRQLIEGMAQKVLKISPDRIEPREDHFLSCSPWQILPWEEELKWKCEIARETFQKIGKFSASEDLSIVGDEERQWGYRNKMEYSFIGNTDGKVLFAFFQRGRHWKVPINDCQLARQAITDASKRILEWINAQKIPADVLKSLIVRGNRAGDVIAGLFVTDRDVVSHLSLPNLSLKGFILFYSRPEHPAASPDALIAKQGTLELTEVIDNTKLTYGLFSFFQVNEPIFEHALSDIKKHVTNSSQVLDFYSGVGSIGLPLAKTVASCELFESGYEAVAFAQRNISENNIRNAQAECSLAEKMIEKITSEHILIVDPPRSGLHPKVLNKIMETKPEKVIYLSCDLATQARDVGQLLSAYSLIDARLYNFFPRTPHIEGMIILERK